ncbi:MAG: efflux RND transporter periplasmic adaptor subunit [Bacilli bacterium]|nr:efflux RND transporter periplasmic adaptor subunit [Bacilli bacterium]
MIKKIKDFLFKHKIVSIAVFLLIIFLLVIINWPKEEKASYLTEKIKKGDIDVVVSGSGQVSSLKSQDISSSVSGNVINVYIESGDKVNKNEVLFKIDSTSQIKDIKTAELNLEKAKLELEEIKDPLDQLTLLQSENSLIEALESKEKAEESLTKSYTDGFNAVSNAFLSLPTVMRELENLLFDNTIEETQDNINWYVNQTDYKTSDREKGLSYREKVYTSYNKARLAYTNNFDLYKSLSRSSDEKSIEDLIDQTYNTTVLISDAIRDIDNYVSFVEDSMELRGFTIPSVALAHKTSLNSYMSTVNNQISSIFSAKNTIENNKDSIVSVERSIVLKELSLADLKEGATDLEIRTKEIAVETADQELSEAYEAYNDCSIKSPFSGTISSVDVIKGEKVSTNETMASIITDEMIATITLNEVDVTNVKVGQEVNLTFDAIDDLSIKGNVSEVDASGTVSQGVVSYNITISFESEDERIKPGMSVSADIIINSAKDVLIVSSSAIKTMGKRNSVQVLNNELVEIREIEIGLTNDTSAEIKSGLNEGDLIITSTNSSTQIKQSSNQKQENNMDPGMMRMMNM